VLSPGFPFLGPRLTCLGLQLQARVTQRGGKLTDEEQVADEIFKNTYIPRTLAEFSLEEALDDVIKVDTGNDQQVQQGLSSSTLHLLTTWLRFTIVP